MFCDGWATVEDMADTLVERVHLSPEEAQSVADEARQAMGGVARAAPSPISPTVKLRQVLRSTVDPRLANQALEPHDKVLPGVRIPPPWVYQRKYVIGRPREPEVVTVLVTLCVESRYAS